MRGLLIFVGGPALLALLLWFLWPSPALQPIDVAADEHLITKNFVQNLVHPEDAIWTFKVIGHYRFGGDIFCGTVNSRNSALVYMGERKFYAIINGGKVTDGAVVGTDFDDPTHSAEFTLEQACAAVITN